MNHTYFASEIRHKNSKKQYMKNKKYNKKMNMNGLPICSRHIKALLCKYVFFEVARQGLGASTTASPSQLPLATGAAVGSLQMVTKQQRGERKIR